MSFGGFGGVLRPTAWSLFFVSPPMATFGASFSGGCSLLLGIVVFGTVSWEVASTLCRSRVILRCPISFWCNVSLYVGHFNLLCARAFTCLVFGSFLVIGCIIFWAFPFGGRLGFDRIPKLAPGRPRMAPGRPRMAPESPKKVPGWPQKSPE